MIAVLAGAFIGALFATTLMDWQRRWKPPVKRPKNPRAARLCFGLLAAPYLAAFLLGHAL